MAGWQAYNPHTGAVETGLYEYPFMVRGRYRYSGESTTVASFRTREEAEEWADRHEIDYLGEFVSLTIENWNE